MPNYLIFLKFVLFNCQYYINVFFLKKVPPTILNCLFKYFGSFQCIHFITKQRNVRWKNRKNTTSIISGGGISGGP